MGRTSSEGLGARPMLHNSEPPEPVPPPAKNIFIPSNLSYRHETTRRTRFQGRDLGTGKPANLRAMKAFSAFRSGLPPGAGSRFGKLLVAVGAAVRGNC